MESKINENFLSFIDKTPNAFCCTENLKNILNDNGFKELYENEEWSNLKDGNYFVIRNDSSLIAFKLVSNSKTGFNITATHADSPSFSIKTNPEIFDNGYLKLNIGEYGGMINYAWLDRPLSLAGRVIINDNDIYRKEILNIDKDLLIIPSQAIHINRDVNTKNSLNPQIDMMPIISLSEEKNLKDIIKEYLSLTSGEICDYDLYLYNRDKAKRCGLNDEFILAPRLDDLACLYTSLQSFIKATNEKVINVFCAFNNEEIGSLTEQGADSNFLLNILTRISKTLNIDLLSALNNSFLVSADNAHALHPNAQAKSDLTNKVYLNQGVVIKHHTNYTTDGWTSSLFKGVCDKAKIPFQDFASRADMKCGSTLGGISQSHVSIDSIDIGIPQLAMHSANEIIGASDLLYMYKALLQFYQTAFIKEKNTINFNN